MQHDEEDNVHGKTKYISSMQNMFDESHCLAQPLQD